MTVNVTKPQINVREKLSELDKPSGIAGEAILRSETPQEVFNYIGAGRRNLIINGDMRIAQRGTSAVTANSSAAFTTDRFKCVQSSGATGSWTTEQSTDAPDGFSSSTKGTVTATESFSGTNIAFQLIHQIEGNNFIAPAWGTSSAKDVTLSFWVKSSVTGAYSVSFHNNGYTRNYVTNYSISSANTWEYKTIVIPGDTSGTWLTTNGIGCDLRFNLGCTDNLTGATGSWGSSLLLQGTGAVDWGSNLNATFYLTGVQLEVGSVATPFEHRSYGEELALCQRYYFEDSPVGRQSYFSVGHVWSTSLVQIGFWPPVPMRTHPTLSHYGVDALSQNTAVDATAVSFDSGYEGYNLKINVNTSNSGFTSGYAGVLLIQSFGYMKFDAEL